MSVLNRQRSRIAVSVFVAPVTLASATGLVVVLAGLGSLAMWVGPSLRRTA